MRDRLIAALSQLPEDASAAAAYAAIAAVLELLELQALITAALDEMGPKLQK